MRRVHARSVVENRVEMRAVGQPHAAAEPRGRVPRRGGDRAVVQENGGEVRRGWAQPARLRAEARPAFGAAGVDDGPPGASAHPRAKPVRAFAFDGAGLKGAFHGIARLKLKCADSNPPARGMARGLAVNLYRATAAKVDRLPFRQTPLSRPRFPTVTPTTAARIATPVTAPHCHSGDSRNPESFVQFLVGPIKACPRPRAGDAGLRIQSGVAAKAAVLNSAARSADEGRKMPGAVIPAGF